MRRRKPILLLLATGALVAAGVALADPPATTNAVPVFIEAPDAQVGAAVAVDPAGGSNVHAVALDTDWRSGALQPQTGYASGTISTGSGAASFSGNGLLPGFSGADVPGGSPDVVWGRGTTVYAVELGRDPSDPQNPCSAEAGVYLAVSNNAGGSWMTYPIQTNGPFQVLTDPSIAYSAVSDQLYISYTKTDPCSGGPSATSVIRLTSDTPGNIIAGSAPPVTGVTGGAANPQFGHSSITALPNGNVVVAYYDGSQSPGQVLATTCSPASCGAPTTVDGSATDPGLVGTVPVDVRPMIAAGSDGRVVVAWAEQTATGVGVFSATSRDLGASFGPPVRVPAGANSTDQFDPSLAIAPDGRADVAFYETRPGGYEVAVSASNKPTGVVNQETWSQSVAIESTVISPVAATSGGPPTLGGRLGVDEVPRPGRAWTLVAWTDTRDVLGNTNEDIFSTVLLHQSTSPIGVAAAPIQVPKNVVSSVPFTATDADADPLTYSIAQQGALGTASIPDPNVPAFLYSAPKVEATDQVQIRLDDGVHQSTMTVPVQIVNTPPTITCTSLTTTENTPVSITAAGCASDLNGDPVKLTATSPANGTLQPSGSGVNFVPTPDFTGTGQVTLTASDGSLASAATIPVHVLAPPTVAVNIVGDLSRSARTDRPIYFHGVPATDTNDPITWKFGDKAGDQGEFVSHLYQKAGTYDVTAQIGNGPAKHVKVIVQKPPLTLPRTTVGPDGSVELHVQLANTGRLTVGMVGVPGAHPLMQKLKGGAHTIRMVLPDGVRRRGAIVVNLALTLSNGGDARMTRAIMLPRN